MSMAMEHITVRFETELDSDQLHELLCLAIHEQDPTALEKLFDKIADIELVA